MDRAPKKRSVPPKKTLASGEVLVSEARKFLPTLTDEGETRSTEDTEPDSSESVRELFANRALPSGVEARFDFGPRSHALTSIRTVIGRGAESDIQIDDRKASKKHASVFFTGSEFRIRDAGSSNGTFLNGSKVDGYVIRDGDQVRIGDTLLRFATRTCA